MPEEKYQKQEQGTETPPTKTPKEKPGEKRKPDQEIKELGSLFGPAAVVMFPIALFLDLGGFVILCCGLDDLGILDIIGLFFLGSLMYLRSGTITTTSRAKKIASKLFKRIGLAFLIEIIPFLGNIAPCWTLAVYYELRG